MLSGASVWCRDGQRVSYGAFVRMMGLTVKQSLDEDEWIFRQGDPVRFFYALLDGEVSVMRRAADGTHAPLNHTSSPLARTLVLCARPPASTPSWVRLSPRRAGTHERLNTLRAGEYFGENSLLSGGQRRSVGMRCASPVTLLKLAKDDFEAGMEAAADIQAAVTTHLHAAAPDAQAAEAARLRSRLLGFIQMVTPSEHLILEGGEAVCRRGDPVDHFYILHEGRLTVTNEAGARLGEIRAGECFGEMSLLAGHSI
jgi:CRP-like cAMP-binding protein